MGIFIAAYSYIAAVIGAGFASGQEILSFFVIHGRYGFWGILLAGFIFGWVAYFTTETCRINKTDDYNKLIDDKVGSKINAVSKILTLIFLIASFSVMTACFGEMAFFMFGVNKKTASAIFDILCVIIVCTGADKALKLNGFMGIIISIGIISVVLYILRYREHQTFSPYISSFISGGGYAGYNLIGSGIILAKMSKNISSKKDSVFVGIISGISLSVMMTVIYILLSIYYKYINLGEIPILTLAMRENKIISYIYSIILAMAVISTGISSNIGATEIMGGEKYASAAVGIIGFCLSNIGFSNMINTIYKTCGYAGILLMFFIILRLKIFEKGSK